MGQQAVKSVSKQVTVHNKASKTRTRSNKPGKIEVDSDAAEEALPESESKIGSESPKSIDHNTEIQRIILGKYSIAAWYKSPYPSEYGQGPDLYICERCLKYMRHRRSLEAHRCEDPFPRGRAIYEDASTVVYEVDGKEHTLYCQNMCLLSKLFLDQKTIYYDIGGFLFYILLVKSVVGGRLELHFAGYFSKEKTSVERNNLACILVLPPFRGQNYGQLLIELSYELTRLENTTGGPEQPLSSQGFHSYRSYWRRALVQALLGRSHAAAAYLRRSSRLMETHTHRWDESQRIFSLGRLSRLTGIRIEDVLFTLEDLDLIQFWRGRHVVCIADETIQKVVSEKRMQLGHRIDYDGLLVGCSNDMSDDMGEALSEAGSEDLGDSHETDQGDSGEEGQ
ncbi:K(lysine) acetyltransferase [Coemansia sp. IMI 203386]|nr:K(lysine) acetyltransferase [Coemansia sp. IMI 203386]